MAANWLTEEQINAITDAFRREFSVGTSNTWEETKDLTIAGLCSANQDALIDDLYEDIPDDRPNRADIINTIRVYDVLLGTHRADEIPTREGNGSYAGRVDDLR